MFELALNLVANVLVHGMYAVQGSLGNELQGLIWFLVIIFLPLAIALVVISYLSDILPFLKRFIPWI